ncbi:MAG TPA: hypothetical protein VFO10_02385 [Oligoflexus sp.]|uniref:hypothetical protein n=1 Tax=Oligoflexus sp. TaxID=1971216 RepID=UPI002D8014B9|nr:hypothetical protein [Oligoflexus sp.]HET9236068.1 hypothetical protein [Oligoflexus sp.]
MHLPVSLYLLVALSAMLTGACSFFSNTVDEIKIQCGINEVDADRSYVKVLDSEGKGLKASEFAFRWLDHPGKPLATRGHCLQLDPKERAALIVRSRVGSEGLILDPDSLEGERLSRIQLEPYTYGTLRKTCDQIINSNQLTLALPINFEDHSATGYEIKADAIADGKARGNWNFVNEKAAAPTLDISGLNNGRYDLRFELNPLFSEGAVPQFFNCDLVVDRKSPQIELVAADGLALSNEFIELRPSTRVAWQSLNRTATELVEYCFVAAGTAASECSNPSISNDPIVVPDNGSWKFVYRGIDAANNRSDWAALDIDIVDEVKLADIRNKLELARVYQKSGQTQLVATQLLLALETYRHLASENERKRVKKALDLAVFQHQRDAQDFFVAQWGLKEAVDYQGTLRGTKDASAHVFLRDMGPAAYGLSFVRDGAPLFPEVSLTNRSALSTCSSQSYTAYVQNGRLQVFDGNTVTTLPGDAKRLEGIKTLKFSEDCRFIVMSDWIGVFFLIDRLTGKTVEFPEFEYDMECRFSFALGGADATRYYSYCSRFNRNSFKLYGFNASGTIETPNVPILNQLPQQLISQDNFIFVLANDKSFAVLDEAFSSLFSAAAGRVGEISWDALRSRVLARYEGLGLYDNYELSRVFGSPTTVKKLSPAELRIPYPVKFGDSLTVSQPSFSPDLFYARMDDATNAFLGQLPVDRDRLLAIDFADLALLQSEQNLFREISPNASLLRRTIRLLRDELSVFPIARGGETVLYTMPVQTGLYNRYELSLNQAYASLAKNPGVSRTLPKDRIMTVYPYGSQELILLKGSEKLQFVLQNQDGTERSVDLSIPPSALAIPSSDPDLFWFYVPGETRIYTVKPSSGAILSTTTVATGTLAAPLQIFHDRFAGELYLGYPEILIKLSYRGTLEKPEFFAVAKKALKSRVTALAPSRDFKKWVGMSSSSLDIYSDSLEPELSLSMNEVFGKKNNPNFDLLAQGLDPDTVFVTSNNGQIARVDLKSAVATSLTFDRQPYSNMIKHLSVDDSGRLQYATGSDWFTLPLDLDDNREHLCRYLTGLGNRMHPEVKTQFKQTTCALFKN